MEQYTNEQAWDEAHRIYKKAQEIEGIQDKKEEPSAESLKKADQEISEQQKFDDSALEKKEEPLDMNNFPFYLPGGFYRDLKSYRCSEEQKRIMEAIDKLIAKSFSGLSLSKVEEIMGTIAENKEIIDDGMKYQMWGEKRGDITKEKLDPELREALIKEEEVRGKLRPLFNRLIEMGFDVEILRGFFVSRKVG